MQQTGLFFQYHEQQIELCACALEARPAPDLHPLATLFIARPLLSNDLPRPLQLLLHLGQLNLQSLQTMSATSMHPVQKQSSPVLTSCEVNSAAGLNCCLQIVSRSAS